MSHEGAAIQATRPAAHLSEVKPPFGDLATQ
jgi:hypothetical protein